MWRCEMCNEEFEDEMIAVEVRFGYVNSQEVSQTKDQYMAFYTESAWAPLCDNCAVAYIKGEENNESRL